MDDLNVILMGGQAFSWTKVDDEYVAVLDNRVWRVKSFDDVTDPFLKNYFDLDFDYEKARTFLKNKDSVLKEAVEKYPSLRILRQDPFIALLSFIISQNNNIKRIKLIYDRISKAYGTEVEKGWFAFPTAKQLANVTEEDFASLGTGFRARYLVDAIKKVDILNEIPNLDYIKARELLQTIVGIGPKVADCVLLFGFHRMEAFPLDVWMKKVMKEYYPDKDISYFEPYPALAQQYLFSWIREKETDL